MSQQSINPDVISQKAIQAKLNVYQAKEHFESVLKIYNDNVANLVNLVSVMKNRILELEKKCEDREAGKSVEEAFVDEQ